MKNQLQTNHYFCEFINSLIYYFQGRNHRENLGSRPLRWWAESAPPGWDRVKVSENLGATAVAPVAPADTSL